MKCSVCGNESEADPCEGCKKKFGDLLDQKVVDSVHTKPNSASKNLVSQKEVKEEKIKEKKSPILPSIFFFVGLGYISLDFLADQVDLFTIIKIAIFGVILWFIIMECFSKEQKGISEETFKILADKDFYMKEYLPSESILNKVKALGIDKEGNKICVLVEQGSKDYYKEFIYNYTDIIDVEICECGQTITKTSRSSQIGGAILGGIALGGVGAIIGGLSGKTSSQEKINSIELKLTVNDINNPVFSILLLGTEHKKGSFSHKCAMERANHWYGLMSILIKKADKEVLSSQPEVSATQELLTLSELLDKNLITREEFDNQKEKIMLKT